MTLQFKIQIRNITKPPVWRRILIPAELTFHEFHYVIQSAFGWYNEHLYKFQEHPYDRNWSIEIPEGDDAGAGLLGMLGLEPQEMDSRKEKVGPFLKKKHIEKLVYIYDFGDDWFHDITLEEVDNKQTLMYPRCLDGKGNCPPEDCGGPWGYAMMKEEGEVDDPKYFDLEEADSSVRHFRSMMETDEDMWGRKYDGPQDAPDDDFDEEEETEEGVFDDDEAYYAYRHPDYPKTLVMENPWVGEELCKPEHALGLPEPLVRRILALPKDSLRRDLENLILYHMGLTCEGIPDDYDPDDSFNGVIGSALILLGEVGNSESSLDVVLEVMRQSPEFQDYHFCDSGDDIFVPTICKIGHEGLDKLLRYAKEDGLYCYLQCEVFTAVSVMAFYAPELRGQIVEWFREVLRFYTKHVAEHPVDVEMLSLMVCDVVDLHAPELLPEIKALYETGAVHEGTAGTFKSVQRDINGRNFTNPLENYSFNAISRFEIMRDYYED